MMRIESKGLAIALEACIPSHCT